jgi:hypothetical protein
MSILMKAGPQQRPNSCKNNPQDFPTSIQRHEIRRELYTNQNLMAIILLDHVKLTPSTICA